MHLYIATKGVKKNVDDFINQLVGKWLPWKYRAKNEDKLEDTWLQLAVRPIQLWEIGFPKEHKDIVCSTILGKNGGIIRGNDGKDATDHPVFNWLIQTFSRVLGLKKLEYNDTLAMPIHREAVAIAGLGIKEDYMLPSGCEGL